MLGLVKTIMRAHLHAGGGRCNLLPEASARPKGPDVSRLAKGIIGALAALLLWMALQFAINAFFSFGAWLRNDGFGIGFVKNVISPGVAAYFAFEIVARRFDCPPHKTLGVLFFAGIVAYTLWAMDFNSHHYLSAGRVEEYNEVFWGTLVGSFAAIVGAACFLLPRAFKPHVSQ